MYVTIESFNLQQGVEIRADMASHEIFNELDKAKVECGYIARDNKTAKRCVLSEEYLINLENKLYLCVKYNS